jgi:hypothetical protein
MLHRSTVSRLVGRAAVPAIDRGDHVVDGPDPLNVV